jgi:hypothetical protein
MRHAAEQCSASQVRSILVDHIRRRLRGFIDPAAFHVSIVTESHRCGAELVFQHMPQYAYGYGCTLRHHPSPPVRRPLRDAARSGYTCDARIHRNSVSSGCDRGGDRPKVPSVSLANVYLIVGHYLHHPAEIDSYLSVQRAEAAALRQSTEQRFDPTGLRARLLARCEFLHTAP